VLFVNKPPPAQTSPTNVHAMQTYNSFLVIGDAHLHAFSHSYHRYASLPHSSGASTFSLAGAHCWTAVTMTYWSGRISLPSGSAPSTSHPSLLTFPSCRRKRVSGDWLILALSRVVRASCRQSLPSPSLFLGQSEEKSPVQRGQDTFSSSRTIPDQTKGNACATWAPYWFHSGSGLNTSPPLSLPGAT
jgi:hypothetical protein